MLRSRLARIISYRASTVLRGSRSLRAIQLSCRERMLYALDEELAGNLEGILRLQSKG